MDVLFGNVVGDAFLHGFKSRVSRRFANTHLDDLNKEISK
jgi:hypothetical protein